MAVAAPLSTVASLGIDVELASLTDANLHRHIFSAKEAYYKAHFPLAGTFLDFQEVRLSIGVEADGCSGTFSAADGAGANPAHRHFAGRWVRRGEHVYAGVTCPL